FLDWHLAVLAPIGPSGLAVIGDVSRYATAGRARLASVADLGDRVRTTLLGAGERVTVTGWGAARAARAWMPRSGWRDLEVSPRDDIWMVGRDIPLTGWVTLEVRT